MGICLSISNFKAVTWFKTESFLCLSLVLTALLQNENRQTSAITCLMVLLKVFKASFYLQKRCTTVQSSRKFLQRWGRFFFYSFSRKCIRTRFFAIKWHFSLFSCWIIDLSWKDIFCEKKNWGKSVAERSQTSPTLLLKRHWTFSWNILKFSNTNMYGSYNFTRTSNILAKYICSAPTFELLLNLIELCFMIELQLNLGSWRPK